MSFAAYFLQLTKFYCCVAEMSSSPQLFPVNQILASIAKNTINARILLILKS